MFQDEITRLGDISREPKEFVLNQAPWVIGKWRRGWETKIPDICCADVKVFQDNAREHIYVENLYKNS